jgi:FkbM family methyltransferase
MFLRRSSTGREAKCGGFRQVAALVGIFTVFTVLSQYLHSRELTLGDKPFLNITFTDYNNLETQALYARWSKTNKADFFAIERLLNIFNDLGMTSAENNEPVIVGGTNEGQLSEKILKTFPSLLFFGFEIMPRAYEVAKERLRSFERAEVINAGFSEYKLSQVPIGGQGEGAGLFDPEGQRGWSLSSEQASTVRLADWTRERGITKVKYLIIDTEGHEPKVIRGMDLHEMKNREKFYLFQFELGGTWADGDKRHGSDPWSQYETAIHLEKYGYDLLLIGRKKWLYVRADFFLAIDNPATLDEGFGPFVQGNLLAMHRSTPRELRERILTYTTVMT